MKAALLVAPLFTLGHISLVTGGLTQTATLLLLLSGLCVPFRALQGWVYNRTGILLVVGALHAAGNAAALGGSVAGAGLIPRLYGGGEGQSLLAFAAIGLVVIASTKARLGGRSGGTLGDLSAAPTAGHVTGPVSGRSNGAPHRGRVGIEADAEPIGLTGQSNANATSKGGPGPAHRV
jgi:hypothetical protein